MGSIFYSSGAVVLTFGYICIELHAKRSIYQIDLNIYHTHICPGPAWCVVVLTGVLTLGTMGAVLDPSKNTGWSATPKPTLEVSPEVNTGSKTEQECSFIC